MSLNSETLLAPAGDRRIAHFIRHLAFWEASPASSARIFARNEIAGFDGVSKSVIGALSLWPRSAISGYKEGFKCNQQCNSP